MLRVHVGLLHRGGKLGRRDDGQSEREGGRGHRGQAEYGVKRCSWRKGWNFFDSWVMASSSLVRLRCLDSGARRLFTPCLALLTSWMRRIGISDSPRCPQAAGSGIDAILGRARYALKTGATKRGQAPERAASAMKRRRRRGDKDAYPFAPPHPSLLPARGERVPTGRVRDAYTPITASGACNRPAWSSISQPAARNCARSRSASAHCFAARAPSSAHRPAPGPPAESSPAAAPTARGPRPNTSSNCASVARLTGRRQVAAQHFPRDGERARHVEVVVDVVGEALDVAPRRARRGVGGQRVNAVCACRSSAVAAASIASHEKLICVR